MSPYLEAGSFQRSSDSNEIISLGLSSTQLAGLGCVLIRRGTEVGECGEPRMEKSDYSILILNFRLLEPRRGGRAEEFSKPT